jgi:hypothetical protein
MRMKKRIRTQTINTLDDSRGQIAAMTTGERRKIEGLQTIFLYRLASQRHAVLGKQL